MPPLHPAIVHIPLALIPVAFVADWIGFASNRPAARIVGWWCWVVALGGAAVSVGLGYIDMNRAALAHETHELVDLHMKVGWVLLVSLAVITVWRWRLRRHVGSHPGYLVCAALMLALTLFQGWYGGEMVYAHGAGVAAAHQGVETAARASDSLEGVKSVLMKIPGFKEEHEHESPAGEAGEPRAEEAHAHAE